MPVADRAVLDSLCYVKETCDAQTCSRLDRAVPSATAVVGPACAAHGSFGFHRPFFFHGRAFHDRFAHRPSVRLRIPILLFSTAIRRLSAGYPPGYATYPAAPVYGQGSCQQVESTIVVDGRPRPAYVLACPQPDGTWRVP
jgi:hypothetical protein